MNLALLVGLGAALYLWQRTPTDRYEVRPSVEASAPVSYHAATEHMHAFGDSITYGESIDFEVDQNGYVRKVTASHQGWPELLARMLSLKTGTQTAVWNMGYPGDRANKSANDRLPELVNMHDGSDQALLLMGTNDSNDFEPTPSGLGCTGLECRGTYKGEVLGVIETLRAAGRKTIYVGQLPPAWGPTVDSHYQNPLDPLTAVRNNRIREFNQVIRNELVPLPGVVSGPDLYSCFLSPSVNRFSLFKDALHPNALGYTFIAALWYDVLSGRDGVSSSDDCLSPIFILESLDSYAHGHKQNLLVVGSEYYTDESFALVQIPAEVEEGIWVMQPNANRQNQDPDYLSFDLGTSRATVYIAYDPVGAPPLSSIDKSFVPVTLSSDLAASDRSVGVFGIIRAEGVTGRVRIGGTGSRVLTPDQQAYLVIVVPALSV